MEIDINGKCRICEISGIPVVIQPDGRAICKKCMAASTEAMLYRLPIEIVAEIFVIAHRTMHSSSRSK